MILDEYSIMSAGQHVYRPLAVTDLDGGDGVINTGMNADLLDDQQRYILSKCQ